MMESKLHKAMLSVSRIDNVDNDKRVAVTHKIHQGIKLNVSVNIKGARNIRDLIKPRPEKTCASRSGAPKIRGKLVDLPESLIDELQKSDKKVLDWIAASDQNRDLFILNPIAALQKMELKIDRRELKALVRARSSVSKSEITPPGLSLVGFASKVDLKVGKKPGRGRVTKVKDCNAGRGIAKPKGGK